MDVVRAQGRAPSGGGAVAATPAVPTAAADAGAVKAGNGIGGGGGGGGGGDGGEARRFVAALTGRPALPSPPASPPADGDVVVADEAGDGVALVPALGLDNDDTQLLVRVSMLDGLPPSGPVSPRPAWANPLADGEGALEAAHVELDAFVDMVRAEDAAAAAAAAAAGGGAGGGAPSPSDGSPAGSLSLQALASAALMEKIARLPVAAAAAARGGLTIHECVAGRPGSGSGGCTRLPSLSEDEVAPAGEGGPLVLSDLMGAVDGLTAAAAVVATATMPTATAAAVAATAMCWRQAAGGWAAPPAAPPAGGTGRPAAGGRWVPSAPPPPRACRPWRAGAASGRGPPAPRRRRRRAPTRRPTAAAAARAGRAPRVVKPAPPPCAASRRRRRRRWRRPSATRPRTGRRRMTAARGPSRPSRSGAATAAARALR